ncbi:BRO family protein [Paenibacillus dendritiformis]|uniref:BRO family protein n=1 Tax=Paenibacillus dendritiformis TaxID=130049 RepID=UPI003664AA38
MNKLQVFNFSGSDIRVVTKDGQPWWVAKDVCDVLEIKNSRDALGRLDEDEKGVASTDTLGGTQQVQVVNESGLYSLVLSSRKPEAKQFKRWITHEVIPAIRRTGAYRVPTLTPNEAIALSLKQTAEMMTKLPELESKIETVERKVDEQITLDSGAQRRLQKAIGARVYSIEQDKKLRSGLFQQLHREIKDRWGVTSYKDVRRQDLQGVLRYVDAWVPRREAN